MTVTKVAGIPLFGHADSTSGAIVLPPGAFRAGSFPVPLPSGGGGYSDPSNWTLDQGVDIPAPAHTPLLAVGDGTIVGHFSDQGITGFGPSGPILKLDTAAATHDTAREYVYYGHAGPGNMVADGTHVTAGQTIGEVGAGIVGVSSGPHLEIGYCDVRGVPLGRSTAPDMRSFLIFVKDPRNAANSLKQGQQSLATAKAGGTDAQSGGVANPLGPTNIALDAINAAFSALWNALKGSAVYAGLFVLLVGGGAVLIARGLRSTVESPPRGPTLPADA